MGRSHREVAVICGFDATSEQVAEDIVPLGSYRNAGSILLNSEQVRQHQGIRFVSVRVFDENGSRTEDFRKFYASDGREISGFDRMPDGTIIEGEP
ncbi:MAG TPA: hypothetical protein VKU82_10155 [Planctomycetaceae bacterium]|nr:hypothetical protein [Planctomycetaceae bacterium]